MGNLGNPSSFGQQREPGRMAALTAVALLHVGAVYAVAHWGFDRDRPEITAPFQVAFITSAEQVMAETPPLPTPMPEFTPVEVFIEQPEIELPRFEESTAITAAVQPAPKAAPASSAPQPKMVSSVEYLEPLRPRYPPTSRRMREEGTVVLLVLVDEKGQASRVQVRDSSGYPRLDRAAEEAVQCARFKPYVEDGRAQPALVLIPVEFSLNTRVARS